MMLPDKFKFTTTCCEDENDAELVYEAVLGGESYKVSWEEDGVAKSVTYLTTNAADHVQDGVWTILPGSFKDLRGQ